MHAPSVDLNADIGEGFGVYTLGNDRELLDIVTSASVACGFHAGDPDIMAVTFRDAARRGVNVGAHPGFPDLRGFGRRSIPFSNPEIERLVAYQIGAAQALSAYAGHPITYVKLHGALGNLTQQDADVATAVCKAIKSVDPKLTCMTFAVGAMMNVAQSMHLRTCAEVYADRTYDDRGGLISRGLPGAVLDDPLKIADRVVGMVLKGAVETIGGKTIQVKIESICVHGDSPVAVKIASRVRTALEEAGIVVNRFSEGPRT